MKHIVFLRPIICRTCKSKAKLPIVGDRYYREFVTHVMSDQEAEYFFKHHPNVTLDVTPKAIVMALWEVMREWH